jgi:carboxyl-terminal processing protease
MPKRNLIGALAIVAAAVATVLLTRNAAPPPSPSDPDQIRFRPVLRAYRLLREQAYHRPDERALQQGAVRGMAESLDAFSGYVPASRVAAFRARLNGRVLCVGLVVDVRRGEAEVIGSLPGSPAHRAGIVPGGRLVSVNGQPAAELGAEEIRQLLVGPTGEPVAVVLRDRGGRRRRYELEPRRFPLETVTGWRRAPDGSWDHWLAADERIAFLRIREFAADTTARVRRALRTAPGARGLVMDLRDNPGGGLEIGFSVANLFLRGGVILTKIDRRGRRQSFSAQPDGTLPGVPMVVLVNGQTASAAEIVAGALRLHGRAVLVGTRTRGKGLVQSLIPLPDDLGLVNLTTAEFLLGLDGRVARRPGAEAWGVDPHREVALTAAEESARRRFWLEADVVPPRSPLPASAPATAPATGPATRPAGSALSRDRQLAEVLALLRRPGAIEKILAEAAAERKRREKQPPPPEDRSDSAPAPGAKRDD